MTVRRRFFYEPPGQAYSRWRVRVTTGLDEVPPSLERWLEASPGIVKVTAAGPGVLECVVDAAAGVPVDATVEAAYRAWDDRQPLPDAAQASGPGTTREYERGGPGRAFDVLGPDRG